MFADELLEQTYGYAHLHIHRIHLANNLVKLEACAGRLDAALSLAADVLQYVAGEVGTIDAPTRWGSAWTSALCEDAQRYLAIQTTREIGCALAGLGDAGTLALWQQSIAPLQQAPCHPSRAGNLAEWYQLKGLYLASAFQTRATAPTYLEHAALYLAQGPRGDALCWQLVALDVLLACENSEHPDSCLLRQQIIDALDRAPVLPRHLRNLLRRVQPRKPAAEQGVSDRRAYAASRTGSHGD